MVTLMRDRLVAIRDDARRAQRFDLFIWTNGVDENESKPEADCGFAGCVLGWAGHERWFEPHGFRIKMWNGHPGSSVGHVRFYVRYGDDWHESERDAHVAFAEFLGLPPEVVGGIIYADRYTGKMRPSIDDVLERVEYLLEQGEEGFDFRFPRAERRDRY